MSGDNQDTVFEDSFSREVWETTYKDHKDDTVDDTMRRVARYIASAEKLQRDKDLWEEKFYDMLSGFKGTVGGRTYSNAGVGLECTLHNCFVSPRDNYDIDSIPGIFKDILNQTLTLKSEGGWGQNFSWIRPRGAFIHGIGVESPGAVKYMEIYDKTSDVITAGSGKKSKHKKAKGKIRKGAMMGIIDCTHPDVIEFITAKQSPGRLTKFNMSVNCTDEFMNKVIKVLEIEEGPERDEEDKWDLRYPDTTYEKYKEEWDGNLKVWEDKGYPVNVFNTVSATWLWNLIMESTYNRAEPGILFLDRANYYNPGSYFEQIVASNPCGEQQLSAGNICCLGSMNLTQFVKGKSFDYEKLRKFVGYMVRFLDNVNSLSLAPLPEYEEAMRLKRRIGIGILGWGSALYMLKVRFGSEEAGKLRGRVMKAIAQQAYMASIDLAEEKGMFDYCDPEKHTEGAFISKLGLSDEYMDKLKRVGIRNSSLLSIQPTGNTSVFANVVSGGLEPVFLPEYVRTAIVNHMPDEIADVCPKWFEGEWHETDLFKFTNEGDEEILRGVHNGTVYKIDRNRGLTKEIECKDYGVRWLQTRGEWDPEADYVVDTSSLTVDAHVDDVNGFARWVDSAISKTINVPYSYPFEEFKEIYLNAYKMGYIKGITTYRDGTMATVLAAKDEKDATEFDEEIIMDDVKVPSQAPAVVSTIRGDGKKWYLTTIMNEQQTRPIAFFVHTNHHEKNVTTEDAIDHLIDLAKRKGIPARWIYETIMKMEKDNNSTKIARAISLNLRHGVLIKNVVFALEQVDNVFVGSFLFQIRKFLMSYIKDGEKVRNGDCPECGAKDSFVFSEGCTKCSQCGYSKCG